MSNTKALIGLRPKPPAKTINISCLESHSFSLCDTDIVWTLVNDLGISVMIRVTMSSGGGAGGIGRIINSYFISGGGGGAGTTINNKPILLSAGDVLHIKIGRGGVSRFGRNGESSYLRVTHGDQLKYEMVLEGGKNGHPLMCELTRNYVLHDSETSGGKGGQSCLVECLSGRPGKAGLIGIPSQMVSLGGSGGCNHFERGGNGGGNRMCEGGLGGNTSEHVDIYGQDGNFGSGGGGSCPLSSHNLPRLSGNGGNGFCILDVVWGDCI